MRRLLQISFAVAALAGIGCGGDDSNAGGDSVAAGTGSGSSGGDAKLAGDTKRAGSGVAIKTAGSQYGKVLFSARNRAIYYFEKESGQTPKCYGTCAEAWPPVLTAGRPRAEGAVRSGMLGTTNRNGGRKQATYKGHPLYYYVNDPQGEVGCHNVEEFGGLWLAVKPSGNPVS